jgi:hypothetical protein
MFVKGVIGISIDVFIGVNFLKNNLSKTIF